MKKIRLFSTVGLVALLATAADFNKIKSDILDDGPIQMIELQDLSTPVKDGISTKFFFPDKPVQLPSSTSSE